VRWSRASAPQHYLGNVGEDERAELSGREVRLRLKREADRQHRDGGRRRRRRGAAAAADERAAVAAHAAAAPARATRHGGVEKKEVANSVESRTSVSTEDAPREPEEERVAEHRVGRRAPFATQSAERPQPPEPRGTHNQPSEPPRRTTTPRGPTLAVDSATARRVL
jgi:hypothetical protein